VVEFCDLYVLVPTLSGGVTLLVVEVDEGDHGYSTHSAYSSGLYRSFRQAARSLLMVRHLRPGVACARGTSSVLHCQRWFMCIALQPLSRTVDQDDLTDLQACFAYRVKLASRRSSQLLFGDLLLVFTSL